MLITLDPDPKPCTEGLSSALVPDGLSANPSAFYPFPRPSMVQPHSSHLPCGLQAETSEAYISNRKLVFTFMYMWEISTMNRHSPWHRSTFHGWVSVSPLQL